jgi:hypothetical protein
MSAKKSMNKKTTTERPAVNMAFCQGATRHADELHEGAFSTFSAACEEWQRAYGNYDMCCDLGLDDATAWARLGSAASALSESVLEYQRTMQTLNYLSVLNEACRSQIAEAASLREAAKKE